MIETKQAHDRHLLTLSEGFLLLFYAAAAQQPNLQSAFARGRLSIGAAGAVDLSDEVLDSLRTFVHRAAKCLGAAGAHEKSIQQTTIRHAHAYVAEALPIQEAARRLIDTVLSDGRSRFDYLVGNRLFRFAEGVQHIRIGRVQAMLTDDFIAKWRNDYPEHRVRIKTGASFSFNFDGDGLEVGILPACWLVMLAQPRRM